jgi:hypothetical protein
LRHGGAVFTFERLHARSAEELWAHTKSRRDTLARRAIYWTAREYAGFIARFWYIDQSDIRLPDFGSDDERLRWLAALSITEYPGIARGLLERLNISRTNLRLWVQGPPEGDRRRPGGREREYWPNAEQELLEWLEQEGEPDTLAEVESWLAENLEKKGHFRQPRPSAYMLIAASPRTGLVAAPFDIASRSVAERLRPADAI